MQLKTPYLTSREWKALYAAFGAILAFAIATKPLSAIPHLYLALLVLFVITAGLLGAMKGNVSRSSTSN